MTDENLIFQKVKEKFIDKNGRYKSSRIYWNLWEDDEESVGLEFCYGFINPFRSRCFIDTVKEESPETKLRFVSDLDNFNKSETFCYSMSKDYDEFMLFQSKTFLFSGLLTKFFIFDDSYTWLMHVDESVLFTSEDRVLDVLVSKLGGRAKVISSMQDDLQACSGYAKVWRKGILNSFKRRYVDPTPFYR